MSTPLPFEPHKLAELAQRYGTPLWVYDAATVLQQVQRLRAFDAIRFAQKANSNIHLLRLLRDAGVLVDAVSAGEVARALAAGYKPDAADPVHAPVVFTADLITPEALALVAQQRIVVNCGSIDMLGQLAAVSPAHPVWLRINPGFGHGHSRKTNTGGEHSKHGIWHTELDAALAALRHNGLRLVGLHMHIGSGVDYAHLQSVCAAMVGLVRRVQAAGADVQAISAGGGLSTPYRASDSEVDVAHYFSLWDAARRQAQALLGHPLRLEIEPGRYLVAQAGVLLAQVRAVKRQGGARFVLVDAGFNDLMRPALYGAHHAITVLRADGTPASGPLQPTLVAGPLCESGDVFTQGEGGEVRPIQLPAAQVGDWLVFHDAGAYGASMSSNYNARALAPEVLVEHDARGLMHARLIRRRQRIAELLALETDLDG